MSKPKTVTLNLGENRGKTIAWSFADPEKAKAAAKRHRIKNPDKP